MDSTAWEMTMKVAGATSCMGRNDHSMSLGMWKFYYDEIAENIPSKATDGHQRTERREREHSRA